MHFTVYDIRTPHWSKHGNFFSNVEYVDKNAESSVTQKELLPIYKSWSTAIYKAIVMRVCTCTEESKKIKRKYKHNFPSLKPVSHE